MAKGFNIILGTTDSTNVSTNETVVVRAGAPHFDPPTVGFSFPGNLAPRQGAPTGPYWPVGQYWAFGYCRVTPTPSGDGTGRFFVQTYYDSGHWPHQPERKFHQTFDGLASTLNATLYPTNTDQIEINAGGGVSPYGFATSGDVSGLRHALVVTNDDLTPVYQSARSSFGGSRMGFRRLPKDDILAIYHDDQDLNKFMTIEHLETGFEDDGVTRKVWPAGTQVIAHPYHYVPLYRNDGVTAYNVLPRIAVIEEGQQFPLTGLVNATGSTIAGLFTRFLSEVASGTQMAIRFGGNATWYIVSGIQSNSGMTLHTYGDTLAIISGTMEAVPFAVGSGLVSVGPGLAGCADWDVALYPDYHNGDSVPYLAQVPFTANLVAINPGGAPSGTASYRWEVQQQGGPITTITNSGNAITASFISGVRTDVRVFVSGTGQPTCVHSDATGYIGLSQSLVPGEWWVDTSVAVQNVGSTYLPNNKATVTNTMRIRGQNMNISGVPPTWDLGVYFHHCVHEFIPRFAVMNADWNPNSNPGYLSVKKGQIDGWPSAGVACVARFIAGSNPVAYYQVYCTYTGKQTGTTDDRLTGVVVTGAIRTGSTSSWWFSIPTYQVPSLPASLNSITTIVFQPAIQSWPFIFVKSRVSNVSLGIDSFNQSKLLNARTSNQPKKLWFFKPGQAIHINTYSATPNAELLNVTSPLPAWVDAGTIIALAPWDSYRGGAVEDVVSNVFLNGGNTAFFYLTPLTRTLVDSVTTFSMLAFDATINPGRLWFRDNALLDAYVWMPKRGKFVVPNVDRTKTLVISYDNWDRTTGHFILDLQYDGNIQFTGCRVVSVNGSPTSGYIEDPQFAIQYKDVLYNASTYMTTKNGSLPNVSYVQGAFGIEPRVGLQSHLVDLVIVNRDPTSQYGPGSEGTRVAETNWEKAILTNYPTNAISFPDPIYNPYYKQVNSTGGGGGGGGGCFEASTPVVIRDPQGINEEIPICKVGVGDKVQTIDREGNQSFQEVTMVRALEVDSILEIITSRKRQILVTSEHPIATLGIIEWTKAGDLTLNSKVLTEDGPEWVTRKREIKGKVVVYDLTVDSANTFMVNGILVHNKRILY